MCCQWMFEKTLLLRNNAKFSGSIVLDINKYALKMSEIPLNQIQAI